VLAYSPRVAATVRGTFVPAAYPVPAEPLRPVEEPVAAIVSDWRWPPNALSLAWLLEAWREVRARVKHARLLLAGWGLQSVGASEGVEVVGAPRASIDVLARAAVMPFPCPDSSGPKVKVMEAMALGLPVVTTPPGVEGLVLPDGAGPVVATRAGFAAALAALLSDPEHRATLGPRGRQALSVAHSPIPAARERLSVVSRALRLDSPQDYK
jgi:glycosyltransferase involved in cell wall biosynthesis